MKAAVVLASIAIISGCSGANISSQIRESGESGSSKALRCIDVMTGNFESKPHRAYRNAQEAIPTGELVGVDGENEKLKKFDGWKLVYISEYTTPNKATSAAVMCFERPFEK